MGSDVSQQNAQPRALRAWQLALLRFAVTREISDRQAAWAIATELDRLGGRDRDPTAFTFFRRTTQELCAAVLQPEDSSDAVVRRHLARIEDDRLKRTFQAALEPAKATVAEKIEPAKPTLVEKIKADRRNGDLWKGLAPRHTSAR